MFAVLAVLGTARAFMNPAADALAPNLLPKEAIAHGISLNSMSWQIANICGPVAGGLLYGISAPFAYGTALALIVVAAFLVAAIGRVPQAGHARKPRSTRCSPVFASSAASRWCWAPSRSTCSPCCSAAPSRCCRSMPATSWMPGRSASGCCARRRASAPSPWRCIWRATASRTGPASSCSAFVAAFGVFTVLFGVSTWVPLSIFALAMMGACDMVSVYIRETLMQLWTPDDVRGRVNAVNRVFIGASNELGEFRAGVVASRLGAVAAVVFGGVGTVAVAALWSRWFPELREARTLSGPAVEPAAVNAASAS